MNFDWSKWWDIPSAGRQAALENYDRLVPLDFGFFGINVTILNSWLVMLVIVLVSVSVTRGLKYGKEVSRRQIALESLVLWLQKETTEISGTGGNAYLGMALGLFCYIITANFLTVIPWFRPPTASLSTTMALAAVVFFAIPYFSVKNAGIKGYLKKFIEPVPFLLPLNVFSEIFSVLAMGLRLFGNMLSGVMFAMIISAFIPLLAPLVTQSLGLFTGSIQAYIFALLAVVYSSGVQKEIKNGETL